MENPFPVDEYLSIDPETYASVAVDHTWYEETRMHLLKRIVSPRDAVVDVGCRDGDTLFRLSERLSRGIGVDIDRDSTQAARRRKAAVGADALEFQVGNALRLDLPDRGFDVAMVLGDVLSYTNLYGKTQQVVSEMRRVLAPGGKIVLDGTNWEWEYRQSPHWSCITRSDARRYVFHDVKRTVGGEERDEAYQVSEDSALHEWIDRHDWPSSPQGYSTSLDVTIHKPLPAEWLAEPTATMARYFTIDDLVRLLKAHGFVNVWGVAYGSCYDTVCRAGLDSALSEHTIALAAAEAAIAYEMRSQTGPWILVSAQVQVEE